MQTSTIVAPKVSGSVGTTLTAIGGYTPANSAVVTSLIVANTSSSAVTVQVTLYNGTTDYYMAKFAPVGPGDSLMIGGVLAKITLVNGWYVRVSSSAASSIDATMCVVELT